MQLGLTDEETFALLNLLIDTIEADRYPMSPRIRLLRAIVRKFGKVGGLSNDLEQKLRRYRRVGQRPRNATGTGPHVKDGDRGADPRRPLAASVSAFRPSLADTAQPNPWRKQLDISPAGHRRA